MICDLYTRAVTTTNPEYINGSPVPRLDSAKYPRDASRFAIKLANPRQNETRVNLPKDPKLNKNSDLFTEWPILLLPPYPQKKKINLCSEAFKHDPHLT